MNCSRFHRRVAALALILPSNHGFDGFFDNLYHLNPEQEPENADYPKDPAFREKFGPRGVIHSYADDRIEDTGPLTIERMRTVDAEVTAPSTRPSATGIGGSTKCSPARRQPNMSVNGCRAPGSSRLVRSPAASPSTG